MAQIQIPQAKRLVDNPVVTDDVDIEADVFPHDVAPRDTEAAPSYPLQTIEAVATRELASDRVTFFSIQLPAHVLVDKATRIVEKAGNNERKRVTIRPIANDGGTIWLLNTAEFFITSALGFNAPSNGFPLPTVASGESYAFETCDEIYALYVDTITTNDGVISVAVESYLQDDAS